MFYIMYIEYTGTLSIPSPKYCAGVDGKSRYWNVSSKYLKREGVEWNR